jgi:hypothetical protein
MEPHTAPPGEAWRLGRGPFIFSGVPPLCVGAIDLINESDEKVRVRRIPVVGPKYEALSSLGLHELRVASALPPHQRMKARAFFRVAPYTPPGTYTADLSCGSQHEPVIVHVWERAGLQVDPGEIRLRGAAGEVLSTKVVVTNESNATQTCRDIALVFLEERNWVGRSLVFALRETKEDEGYQAYLDRVVRELKVSLTRPARVTIRTGFSELQPGESRELELEITLPAELVKGRTYFGSTKFMSGKLIFRVECNGASESTRRRPR